MSIPKSLKTNAHNHGHQGTEVTHHKTSFPSSAHASEQLKHEEPALDTTTLISAAPERVASGGAVITVTAGG